MTRGPSALTAIGGFSVAVAALSVATTASVVLLMPDPPVARVTVADAAAALRGRPGAFDRHLAPPPEGMRAPLLEYALADALHRPASAVRVVWLDDLPRRRWDVFVFAPSNPRRVPPGSPPREGTVVTRPPGLRPPTSLFLRRGKAGWLETVTPAAAGAFGRVLATLPQPAFAASARDAAGRWVSVAPRRPLLGGWRLKVIAALGASLALLAPLAWLFARRLTRPFRALAAAIDLGEEPPRLAGPRELRDAAAAIVLLRARAARDAEERLRMLVAVAHDLRTPLTSLKLRIETVAEPARARMIADADRMGAMIGDVLALARVADAPRRRVAVRALVREIVADMPGAGDAIRLRAGPDACVAVVEPAFRRAIENLFRNAIDYAGGGEVDLRREADTVVVTIADAGPGIAAHDRARLLRPFERGDASRNRDTGGAGLGLSIVHSFAELHRGSLTLDDAPGGGTVAALRLPAA